MQIVTRLNSIIDRHVDVETTARVNVTIAPNKIRYLYLYLFMYIITFQVLECFIEWVSFTEESRDYLSNDDIKQQSILSGTFVEWCLAVGYIYKHFV